MATKYASLHKQVTGPGDARPQALHVLKEENAVGKLRGKVIFVTGATSGIGLETARVLQKTGADIYLGVRDTAKADKLAKETEKDSKDGSHIYAIKLELDNLQSIRTAAAEFLKKSKQLNILILNAGVMASPEGEKTKDGFQAQFGVNHLGHFLLFQLLKSALLASSTPNFQSRVVSLSSSGHRISPLLFDDLESSRGGYDKWKAYGQSKTANIYLATEIERRYGSQGLHATAVHPGTIATTNLKRYLDEEQIKALVDHRMERICKTDSQGAATTVWAAIGDYWEGKGGKYLEDCQVSAPFDASNLDAFIGSPGYAPHAYDEEAAKQLWKLSNELVGFKED